MLASARPIQLGCELHFGDGDRLGSAMEFLRRRRSRDLDPEIVHARSIRAWRRGSHLLFGCWAPHSSNRCGSFHSVRFIPLSIH